MRIPTLPLLLLATGCATVGSVASRPAGEGIGRSFPAPLPDVRNALRVAFDSTGMGLKDSTLVNDSTLMIVGSRGFSFWSYGEIVRVLLAGRQDTTDVRVVTARRLATNVTANGDWSEQLFKYMAAVLGDFGRPLVDAVPPAVSQTSPSVPPNAVSR